MECKSKFTLTVCNFLDFDADFKHIAEYNSATIFAEGDSTIFNTNSLAGVAPLANLQDICSDTSSNEDRQSIAAISSNGNLKCLP